jgi:uncharacterized membrane protein (UPF0127 family)
MKLKKIKWRLLVGFVLIMVAAIGLVQVVLLKTTNEQDPITSGSHEVNLVTDLLSLTDSSFHQFAIGDNYYTFEVVNTSFGKTQGLSGRDEIGSDGMLFVFSRPDYHGIWMKDMKFDLDLIWILDVKVVDIAKGIPAPQTQEDALNLPIYRPKQKANLVIEVEAGFVERERVDLGAKLVYKNKE